MRARFQHIPGRDAYVKHWSRPEVPDDPLLGKLPAVVLYSPKTTSNNTPWVAVDRLAYGLSRDALEKTVAIGFTLGQLLTEEPPSGYRGYWGVALPADTQEVWCRFIFRDGDSSEAFRVPVEEWSE